MFEKPLVAFLINLLSEKPQKNIVLSNGVYELRALMDKMANIVCIDKASMHLHTVEMPNYSMDINDEGIHFTATDRFVYGIRLTEIYDQI